MTVQVTQSAGMGGQWPTHVQDLSDGERLVVWAFRRWVSGPQHLSLLAREFDRQFRRSEARPALQALDAALTGLTRHARRTIIYHQPCCGCLGADEVCLISIVAALQSGAQHAADAMAQWLVRREGVAEFIAALDDLAECLSGSGHDLPYRARQRGVSSTTTAQPLSLQVH
ncbi:hypothetical protein [Ferrovibrio sp.]|uniref:hypothetical protein n=1 Tax=Ferrovibrio sp. TaxID=1917215 RepID=UPI002629857E|nr:hypothetical protein [Ferrovibrio sp.]